MSMKPGERLHNFHCLNYGSNCSKASLASGSWQHQRKVLDISVDNEKEQMARDPSAPGLNLGDGSRKMSPLKITWTMTSQPICSRANSPRQK